MAEITGTSDNDALNGTSSADTITGGSGNDTITAGAGNDTVTGGLGRDTAVFSGNAADYTVSGNADGSWTVADQNPADGDDGSDSLTQIEILQFADKSQYLADGYGSRGAEFQVNTETHIPSLIQAPPL